MHAHAGHDEPLMGDEEMEETMDANEEDWENSAHGDIGAHTSGVDAVTFKGNDLASKSRGALKHNGGENPMHEAVVQRLTKMYNEIKSLNENVTLDETGQTFQHILHHYKRDVKDFMDNGEMSSDLFDVLYDYYFDDMPYGVKKARSGDPYEWVSTRFANDMQGEVDENLIPVPNPSGATSVDQAKQLGSMMPAPAGQPDPLSPAPAQYQP
jgi:hypothetical protein